MYIYIAKMSEKGREKWMMEWEYIVKKEKTKVHKGLFSNLLHFIFLGMCGNKLRKKIEVDIGVVGRMSLIVKPHALICKCDLSWSRWHVRRIKSIFWCFLPLVFLWRWWRWVVGSPVGAAGPPWEGKFVSIFFRLDLKGTKGYVSRAAGRCDAQ